MTRFLTYLLGGAIAVAAFAATSARAAPDGAVDPAFVDAVSAWLAGEEETALPALADLARQESDAAQVLISVIDKTADLQGPWLESLDRDARIALLRQPGGLSGTVWIAASDDPLARAWQAIWSVDASFDDALAFVDLGEPRAARMALIALAARERSGFAAAAGDPRYPDTMEMLVWDETGADSDDAATARAALPDGHPLKGKVGAGWLAEADLAAPLRAACDALCAEDSAACTATLFEALGGYRSILTLGSPVEALIPTRTFIDSPVGRDALLRKLAATTGDRNGLKAKLEADGQACLVDGLERIGRM
ncbi:hypothetical protein [Oceanomicrobium pacificus]|uniref:Uncharacterized protein n=1 Tax=Oceanomicrobium pacificus TaxID=2692916 RepID=A0A6B0TVF0_9RHOB|nr:hypothetical protein [Oceanomicrobium pacificus]MXU65124.1 hypothetical protein [Oceanomicrobium pacificus]